VSAHGTAERTLDVLFPSFLGPLRSSARRHGDFALFLLASSWLWLLLSARRADGLLRAPRANRASAGRGGRCGRRRTQPLLILHRAQKQRAGCPFL
jgi:hypothetical protein